MILISGEDYVKLKVVFSFIDAIFCIQSASVKSNDFFNFSSKVVLHKIPDLMHRMSIGVFSRYTYLKLGILDKKLQNYSNQNQCLVTSHYGLVSLHIEILIENGEFERPK